MPDKKGLCQRSSGILLSIKFTELEQKTHFDYKEKPLRT
jgi:hypothetical protein